MNKMLLYVTLVSSLILLGGCGATSAPPLPALPASNTSTPSGSWGTQYQGAVDYCGEFYASYYSYGYGDYQEDLKKWTSFCDCYYSEVSKHVGYNEYFDDMSRYDNQYQQTLNACESKVWNQYAGI
jgi:hypothetical protein